MHEAYFNYISTENPELKNDFKKINIEISKTGIKDEKNLIRNYNLKRIKA